MWRRSRVAVLILVLGAIVSSGAMGAASSWVYDSTHNGIDVYTRAHEGSDVTEVKAVGTLPQTAERIFAVVHDVERYEEFFPFTKESKVVRSDGTRRLLYQLVDPPLLEARDFYVWVSDDSKSTTTGPIYRSTWTLAKSDVKKNIRKDVVRITDMAGRWTVRPAPQNPNHAEVVYWTYTNPGSSIPAPILNAANSRVIPHIFDAILSRSDRPEYASVARAP